MAMTVVRRAKYTREREISTFLLEKGDFHAHACISPDSPNFETSCTLLCTTVSHHLVCPLIFFFFDVLSNI